MLLSTSFASGGHSFPLELSSAARGESSLEGVCSGSAKRSDVLLAGSAFTRGARGLRGFFVFSTESSDGGSSTTSARGAASSASRPTASIFFFRGRLAGASDANGCRGGSAAPSGPTACRGNSVKAMDIFLLLVLALLAGPVCASSALPSLLPLAYDLVDCREHFAGTRG